MANEFSAVWFDTFLSSDTAAPVDRELQFIQKHFPVDRFTRLLDAPCGIGRHAVPLAKLGYEMLGIDRSPAAINSASRDTPAGATFRLLDMADLDTLDTGFDGVICLWQSFGYGDRDQNQNVLRAMARRIRQGGRVLLDVYNSEALRQLSPESTEVRAGRTVFTRRALEGGRFHVEIRYSDSRDTDVHDWLVYSPSELAELGSRVGLELRTSCAWFDDSKRPSVQHLRMQLLFERA